jgi:serine/threonine-protein kinase
MSPEQLQDSSEVDERTDIWAVGAVLYELVSGKPAFDGPNLAVLATKILTQPFKPVSEVAPDVPHDVEAVIVRCLHKDRGQRYSAASDLAAALLAIADPNDASRAARFRSLRPAGAIESKQRSNKVPGWILVVVSIAVVAAAGLAMRSRAPKPDESLRQPEPTETSKSAAAAPVIALPSASAPAPSAAATSTQQPARPPTRSSPRPRASSIPGKPAASGVNVFSDGLLDRK